MWSSANRRGGPLPACSPRTAAVNIHCLHSGSSGAAKRDVTARARSTPGQVGVALVEEVVDATHPEVLRYSSLPGNFSTVRDSYLSIQNLESLTREAAKEVNELERLAASEGASSSSVNLDPCCMHSDMMILEGPFGAIACISPVNQTQMQQTLANLICLASCS